MTRVTPWLGLGLILAVTAVAYRGVIGHGFVFDDVPTVRDNPTVRSLGFVGRWFTSPQATSASRENRNYRPVTVASYALDRAAWGEAPAGFHATNLALHLGVAGLTFILARRLWGDDWAAVGAAAVVALHPINAEAVNYVTARSSILMTLGVLAAVWAHDRATMERRWRWAVAAWAFGLLALGAKEVAVILPGLIIAWDRARGDRTEPWGATLRRSLPWWGLVGGFLAVRAMVLAVGHATAATGEGAAVAQGGWLALKIYLTSLGQWLWPAGLALDHAWPAAVGRVEALWLVAGTVAAGLGTLAAARWDRRIGWSVVWFWTALLPMGALPFVSRMTLYQDNRVYLAGIGLAWSAGWGGAWVVRRWGTTRGGRAAWGVALGLLVVAAGWTAANRTVVWADEVRLWDDVLTQYPNSFLAYNSKGIFLKNAGRLDEARQAFERVLYLAPGFAQAHNNLGGVFAERGDWERAASAFEFALSLDPRYTSASVNLGAVYRGMGRSDLAIDLYERLLRDDPGMAVALVRLGVLLEEQGRFDAAAERFRNALSIDPTDDQVRLALGGVLVRLDRWADAREVFEVLVTRHPDSFPIRFNLGLSLDHLGLHDEAVVSYRAAAALRPDQPGPYFRMAVIHSKRGRWTDAAADYEQALQRDPSHYLSHQNLALVAEQLGDSIRAAEHYRAFLSTVPQYPSLHALREQAQAAIARLRPSATQPKKAGRDTSELRSLQSESRNGSPPWGSMVSPGEVGTP